MLRHRLQSGSLLAAALLGAVLYMPPLGVLPILLVVAALALVEFYALLGVRQIPHFKVTGTVAGLALVAGTWFALYAGCPHAGHAETVLLYGCVAAVLIRQVTVRNSDRPWDSMGGTLFGILYVAFLFAFVVKLLLEWGYQDGRILVLYLIVVVKVTDIGAYSVGCAIGRHKLIPRISPAKTWEGVFGGIAAAIGASLLFARLASGHLQQFAFSRLDVMVIGLLLAVAGILGDLIESLFKRASGVKDSGRMFLGMGGILDILDSLLFAAPIFYLYVRLTAP